MRKIQFTRRVALNGALSAVVIAGGGCAAALATTAGSGNVYQGCLNHARGALYNVKINPTKPPSCLRRDTQISWNQTGPAGAAGAQAPKGNTGATGPQGPAGPPGATGQQGPAGATGATGPAGAPGAGYQFTTASGDNGPTLTSAGTYLVDVSTAVFNQTSSDIGECAVIATDSVGLSTGFNTVWQEPVDNEGTFSLSGMIAVPSGYAPEALSLTCTDSSGGNFVTTLSTSWWVSPVATIPGSTVSESAQSAKAG